MSDFTGMVYCDGCGVEFTWSPILVKRPGKAALVQKPLHYCCEICAEGAPCTCAERMELDDERRGYNQGNVLPGL